MFDKNLDMEWCLWKSDDYQTHWNHAFNEIIEENNDNNSLFHIEKTDLNEMNSLCNLNISDNIILIILSLHR